MLCLVAGARAEEKKVPLDKVPKAVTEAVKARFPDAKVVSASTETEDKKTVYEITLKQDKLNIDVTVTPEGKITTIEKQIRAKSLPKAVLKALRTKYPKAKYEMIEEVIKVEGKKETFQYYEVVVVTSEKKKVEVVITKDGKITKEEPKKEEKKKDKD
jgi:hypothetical protein